MKAMILERFGGTERFAVATVPAPVPKRGEVLVTIKAAGVNPIDVKTRRGGGIADSLRRQRPMILGWDLSGVVSKTGEGVEEFRIGDPVFGTVNFPGPGCAYAEFAAVPAEHLALKPLNVSHEEAAAAAQSPLTAWQALVETGRIGSGARVLIHGGAGGVGHHAVQIAKTLGCYVISTAAGRDAGFVRNLGADEVIDFNTERFEERAKEIDFVLDTVGGENFVRSLHVLRPDGMIVLLPSDRKAEADEAAVAYGVGNYRHILMHSSGEGMRRIADLLAGGRLRVHVDSVFPFGEIARAHERLEGGGVFLFGVLLLGAEIAAFQQLFPDGVDLLDVPGLLQGQLDALHILQLLLPLDDLLLQGLLGVVLLGNGEDRVHPHDDQDDDPVQPVLSPAGPQGQDRRRQQHQNHGVL